MGTAQHKHYNTGDVDRCRDDGTISVPNDLKLGDPSPEELMRAYVMREQPIVSSGVMQSQRQ